MEETGFHFVIQVSNPVQAEINDVESGDEVTQDGSCYNSSDKQSGAFKPELCFISNFVSTWLSVLLRAGFSRFELLSREG